MRLYPNFQKNNLINMISKTRNSEEDPLFEENLSEELWKVAETVFNRRNLNVNSDQIGVAVDTKSERTAGDEDQINKQLNEDEALEAGLECLKTMETTWNTNVIGQRLGMVKGSSSDKTRGRNLQRQHKQRRPESNNNRTAEVFRRPLVRNLNQDYKVQSDEELPDYEQTLAHTLAQCLRKIHEKREHREFSSKGRVKQGSYID